MIDTQAIRNKILDLALRGKLTEQLPEDGTAEELFLQIQQEKQILEKAGKIKKAKPLPPISDGEKQIDIPGNWLFCKLGDLSSTVTDGEHQTPKRINTFQGYYLLSARNVRNGYIDLQDVDYVDKEEYERISQRCNPRKNDVLISCSGSVGRCAVIADNNKYCMVRSAAMLSPILAESKYIMYSIQSTYVQNQIQNKAKQTLQANLFQDAIKNLVIMLPPLTEQCRIIAQIEATFSILDTIDVLQAQYHDNLSILKSKLIDAGIQGKLTEQLPEDGTAEELYQQIQQERQKQEDTGMIKAEEPLPSIDSQSVPFSIPDSWQWTYLGNVSYIVRGGSPRPIKQYITQDSNGINWIKIGDVEKGEKYIYQTHERIIPEGEKKSRRVYPGDFLLTNSMSFGRPYISQIEGCIHDGWLLIRNLSGFDPDYLYYLLSSSYLYSQFTEKASGSTVDNLNIDKVKSAKIPLPPLAEQKRIVAKLEELLPLCE